MIYNIIYKAYVIFFREIGKLLGAGHFGKVYQAVDQKTNKDVAIKVLNKLDHYRETVLKREILALKAVQGGPNIIQYLVSII